MTIVRVIFALILSLNFANAQNGGFDLIKYHSDINLHMGSAFDAHYTIDQKQQCIDYDEIEWVDGGGAVETTLEMELVDNYKKLYERMNLDLNFEASAKINKIIKGEVSADFKSKFEKKHKLEDRTVTLLIKARSDYGRRAMRNQRLKPEFQKMIDEGRYQEFVQKCGRFFINQEKRGAEVYVLIHIRDLSKSAQKKLVIDYKDSFKASFKFVDVSVDKKIHYERFISTAAKLGKIEVSYHAVGTDGMSALDALVSNFNPKNIEGILNAMSSVMANSNKENAAPLQYTVASMEMFGLQAPTFDASKFAYLQKIYAGLIDLNINIAKLENISGSREDVLRYYKNKLTRLQTQRQVLVDAAKSCMHFDNCDEKVIQYFDNIIWPWDMVKNNRLKIQPGYRKAVDKNGQVVGELLDNVSIRVRGKLYHLDQYSHMAYAMADESFNITSIDRVAGLTGSRENINPVGTKRGGMEYYDFISLIDTKHVPSFEFHNNGYVLDNPRNRKKAEQLLNSLKQKSYLLTVFTQDQLETTYDLGYVSFRNIPVFKPARIR